jgi:histidine triad (HIT) family protein
VPNAHYENLYDLPSPYGHAIHDLAREVAIAIEPSRASY